MGMNKIYFIIKKIILKYKNKLNELKNCKENKILIIKIFNFI